MTPADVHAAFQSAANSGGLTGDEPSGLTALLDSLGVTSLPVGNGRTGIGPASAWLTGTTTYLGTPWSMRITGTPRQDSDSVTLVLELTDPETTAPWTFRTAFPDTLPQSRRGDIGVGLALGDSVLASLILERPAVTAMEESAATGAGEPTASPPRLSGTLLLRGVPSAVPGSDILARYADLLGDRLVVDGTMTLAAGAPPLLDLRAVAPDVHLSLAGLQMSAAGLELTTAYPDTAPLPDTGALLSAALLFADVTLPTDPVDTVSLRAPLLYGDNVWPLNATLAPPLGLAGGIEALIAMTSGTPVDFALPPGIAALDVFRLGDLEFGLVPVGDGLPRMSYAMVGILSDRPWDPPVPFLAIDQVGARWALHFDTEGGPFVTGTVFGTMVFGRKSTSSLGAAASSLEPAGQRAPAARRGGQHRRQRRTVAAGSPVLGA